MITLLISSITFAGTYTDAPGVFQGDISIGNDFISTKDQMYQQNIAVGSRNQFKNDVYLHATYGIFDFMSAELKIPFGIEKISFADANQMEFDPLTETGTYLETPSAEDYSLSGNGVQGVKLALNFYPFHSKIFSHRGDRGNWNLGVVYRTPDNSNFFSPSPSGKRGAGIGAQGFGIQSSFSNRNKSAEPYLTMEAIKTSRWTGSIRTENGDTLVDSIEFFPASSVNIRGGTEIFVWEDKAYASHVSLDLFGQYKYLGWQSIPSGIYLPNVLETTTDEIVTQTELVSFQGGLGVNARVTSLYAFRLGGQVGYVSPQRIEHIYDISTLGSFQWGLYGAFTFRYRTTAS
jgi:hypothetical protein